MKTRIVSNISTLLLSASLMGADAAVLKSQVGQVDFDLNAGTFSMFATGAEPVIRGAHVEVEGWSSTDAGYQRRIIEQTHSRMLVECARADAPTLLLEFTLHSDFVELRTGLKNTTTNQVRIKKMLPLTGGAVFPGGAWMDIRTLDAPSGAHQTRVGESAVRSSANNLLLTLKQSGQRRSLVLGALETADFTKWAHTSERNVLEQPGLHVVSYLDCGGDGGAPSLIQVVRGKPYTWPGASGPSGSVLFDEKAVEFQADKLDPQKQYALGFSWWDQSGDGRVESVKVSGADQQTHMLLEREALSRDVTRRAVVLPTAAYADGRLHITFTNEAKVPNAVVSELWLWEMAAGAKLPDDSNKCIVAELEASDPVGRLVEPGETYLPADSFYVDAATADPFTALEKYGLALREATGAIRLNPYDFPTVCAWYAGVWKTQGAQNHPERSKYKINTSSGMVGEAQAIKKTGFTNYARAAVRLVPDNYTECNPQGWWDDKHWQQHGLYSTPYETSAKLGQGMHENGCLAFTYIQPQVQLKLTLSRDFLESHPDWLLNASARHGLDYSMPAVQDYVRSRFNDLRGNISGLMVDYADQLWLSILYGRSAERRLTGNSYERVPAGNKPPAAQLADPKMTATGFYRQFFRCVKDGLGPNSWVHERNLEQPNNDLTLGVTDSQRTSGDTDKITPDMVSRSGLRWYKNRVVIAYDMDSKELYSAWKVNGWTGTDQDGRRMLLAMAYVAASRLLLANSFRDLKPEVLHDLERTFPYPTEPRSARPVDAFIHKGWPRVYDFAVTRDWHQVTLFNSALPTKEETITVPLAGELVDGALGLDPAAEYHVYDFWNDTYVGTIKGSGVLMQTLRPGEARMLSVRKVQRHPQVLSTNRHIMQGYYELSEVKWANNRLTGKARVVAGEPFRITIALNGQQPADGQPLQLSADGKLAVITLDCPENGTVKWSVKFK